MKDNKSRSSGSSAANLGFEAKLWQAADALRNNMDAADRDWRGELLKDDKRWAHGKPPASNSNYAWVQK